MKILVLNGSPKGDFSTTLYTVLYIQKHNPEHSFTILNVARFIRQYEKDFSECAKALSEADLILFSYPVYTFLVPSQLHRFIELIKENNIHLENRWVSQITTSKHFYDVTAHRFIEENCQDLKMKVIKGLSADMEDLTTEKGRKEALAFFEYLKCCIKMDIHEPFAVSFPCAKHHPVSIPQPVMKNEIGSIALVCDLAEEDIQLKTMIESFCSQVPYKTDIVNIHSFPFKGGCISCLRCCGDGKCFYNDGFSQLLRERILKADAIVMAFSIKDHSMGSVFKTYDDRQFCNGHRTVTMGKPVGYLISGNYSQEKNLQTVIEARAEVSGNFLAGAASDEFDPDEEITLLCRRLEFAMQTGYVQPANFYGVGGAKIFRDMIWLMQGMMKADHRFFKQHNQYDFPQKKRTTMWAMYLAGSLFSSPKIYSRISPKIQEGMISPYKKALEK